MAPVIDTYPHVSRTYANMSPPPTSSTAFVALTLSRSANAIELSVPPAPATHAASDLKARSFDFLADLLVPHAAHYSSAELFAAFAGHFPTSAYNATLEAGLICDGLRSAFFHVDHLTALGFRSLRCPRRSPPTPPTALLVFPTLLSGRLFIPLPLTIGCLRCQAILLNFGWSFPRPSFLVLPPLPHPMLRLLAKLLILRLLRASFPFLSALPPLLLLLLSLLQLVV